MTDLYSIQPSQIVVYTTNWCGQCKRTKAFLDENKIPYLNIDLDDDPQAAEFVTGLNNGFQSVPTIIFPDGSKLVEPSTAELQDKFSKYIEIP